MKYVAVAFLALGLSTSVAAKKDRPLVEIVSQSTIHPTNCKDDDPLMPVCTLSHLVVENRAFKPLTATVLCGEDEEEINLSPRTRLVVDVEETLYVPDMKCSIKSVK